LQSSASTKKTELVRGDKVLARSGDFVGLTGTVAQVTGDEIKVALDDHLRTEGIPDELLFNISDLIKRFDIGDSVAVVHGKDVGSSGIVVAIGNSIFSLFAVRRAC
jgi:transcription elongation factor